MRRILVIALVVICFKGESQNVQARIVVDPTTTAGNTVLNFQIRTLAGTQVWVGLTFNFLYQNNGIGPDSLAPQSTGSGTVVGVNDALMVTTYGWGTSNRFTSPFDP